MRLQLTVAACLLLAACGGGGEDPLAAVEAETAPGDDGVITMTGTDALRFNTSTLEAPAGEIGFQLACGDAVAHDVVIEGELDEEPVVECAAGEVSEVGTITLEPGTYTYYCSIPGHRMTMNGELTVTG